MPQIRLTSKAIKELKSPCLNDISRDCEFFDDWYFDILHINRPGTKDRAKNAELNKVPNT